MRTKKTINTDIYGKLPPQALDIETSILGTLIAMSQKIHYDSIANIINPECFYKQTNRIIFEAIQYLFTKHDVIDTLILVSYLRNVNKIDEVGGVVYIAKLTNNTVGTSTLITHAQILFQKYLQRSIIQTSVQITEKAYQDIEDPFELFEENKKQIEQLYETLINATKIPKTTFQLCHEAVQEMRDVVAGKNINEFYTGISKFDRCLMFERGDLVILAGRPGMGKTAFALFLSRIYAKRNLNGVFFTLEMSDKKLMNRIILGEADIDNKKYRSGELNEIEVKKFNEAAENVTNFKISIDDAAGMSMNDIEAKLNIYKNTKDIQFCVVDYLGLINLPGKDNRNNELGIVTGKFKQLAKKHNIPIFLLAQLNRNNESRGEKRPILADLRDSGHIEQDADIVCFFYREYYYSKEEVDKNRFEIIVSKYREGEPCIIELETNENISNFTEYQTNFNSNF
jgi:replicative DNA helicase